MKYHLVGQSGKVVIKYTICTPKVKKKLKELMENKGQEKMVKKAAIERTHKESRWVGRGSSDEEVVLDDEV